MIYKGVPVVLPQEVGEDEAKIYLEGQFQSLCDELGDLAKIEVLVDGDEVALKGYKKDHIRRVRRITGYLSDQENFNSAKRSELADRSIHY